MKCRICNRTGNIIRDYNGFYVSTASNPVSEGHLTIICKEHKPFAALRPDEIGIVAKIAKSACSALNNAFHLDGVKLIVENGEMQDLGLFGLYIIEGVPFEINGLDECSDHMHMEVIPCYNDISRFNVGRKPFASEKDEEIAAKIKGFIGDG